MDVQDAIKVIEESPDYEQFSKLKRIFKDRIEALSENDFTEKGICYYYLLRIVLRSQLRYETEECRDYFDQMNREFRKQLRKYKRDRKKFDWNEIKDYFKLMARCYGSLETIFRGKDFFEEARRAYNLKMNYRKHQYAFRGKWWNWCGYTFLESTSMYGNSFVRWGCTAFVFAVVMAGVYRIIDLTEVDHSLHIIPDGSHWYDYFYFSIVTLTSLGYGDIVPTTFLSKLFVSIQVFFGFIMLGIFISLIQKKM